MLKFMRKIPGGLLLIPMLISALVNTFAPGFLGQFGGLTEALLTAKGTGYVVGLVCFCSAAMLDIKSLGKVLKKQGVLLLVKIVVCLGLAALFMTAFGMPGVNAGVFTISALGFTVAICSINPSMYLAMVSEYGVEQDKGAFGLTGLLCVPAFPIFVFSIIRGGTLDWMPILAVLIPILLGLLIGNLDKDLAKMFGGMVGPLTPFMGWSFGAGINLIDAVKDGGVGGLVISVVYYILMVPLMLLVETKVLKESGISTLGMSSIAGLSISIPSIIALADPSLVPFAGTATAQIAFGVVLTSIITPIITQRYAKKKGLAKPKVAAEKS
jgi:2-keto-3-deoxygluconate permease